MADQYSVIVSNKKMVRSDINLDNFDSDIFIPTGFRIESNNKTIENTTNKLPVTHNAIT